MPARAHAAALETTLQSRLKLRQLTLLRHIEQRRSLSRVATELRLSQPAVSKALQEVEDVFMTPLFDRTARGLVPTPAGAAVLHYARNALAELESTARTLSAIGAGLGGRVRIGVIPHVPQALLSEAIGHLLGQRPRVAVLAREGTTDQLVAAMAARELDCAIGRAFDGEPTEIVQEAIYVQEPCLIVPARSRERLSKGPLDWSRLAALDWILPPSNTPMRRTFNTIFVGTGVQPPEPMVETLSLKAIATVLRSESNAVTILARDLVSELGPHCAALPYRLTWNLPPVTFFVSRSMREQPTVVALMTAVKSAAARMARSDA